MKVDFSPVNVRHYQYRWIFPHLTSDIISEGWFFTSEHQTLSVKVDFYQLTSDIIGKGWFFTSCCQTFSVKDNFLPVNVRHNQWRSIFYRFHWGRRWPPRPPWTWDPVAVVEQSRNQGNRAETPPYPRTPSLQLKHTRYRLWKTESG